MNNEKMTMETVEKTALVNTTTGEIVTEPVASVDVMELLQNPSANFFTSLKAETRKDKIKLYNAINKEDHKLGDMINTVIEVVDVVAHEVVLEDENGVPRKCVRMILVDSEGNTYSSVAEGIISSMTKIFAIVGMPSWADEPVRMKCVSVTTRKGFKTNVLELVD